MGFLRDIGAALSFGAMETTKAKEAEKDTPPDTSDTKSAMKNTRTSFTKSNGNSRK